jgi:hypothetical protein
VYSVGNQQRFSAIFPPIPPTLLQHFPHSKIILASHPLQITVVISPQNNPTMAVLITVAASAKVEMSPKSSYPTSRVAGDSAIMVIPSKRREEVRTVDTGRRASVHWEHDQGCKERRGSKASSRRESVAKGASSDSKNRHGSLNRKKEVLVTRDR